MGARIPNFMKIHRLHARHPLALVVSSLIIVWQSTFLQVTFVSHRVE